MIDYKKFVENSRKWLANYIKVNHLQSCVLGISGGIDSTVSACLASSVCKELNIPLIGRSLPTTSNKICETTTAFKVGEAFCNDFKEVPIENSFNSVFSSLVLNEGHITPLQEGNTKARLRMIYLYHLASIHKGVVIDNDNFTEWNLGFFTRNGDIGDINLGLHYLWKTEIYELAKFLYDECKSNKHVEQAKAIYESVKLTPTDGNGVSNSDCEQFGLDNYSQVDDVLKTMYYNDKFFEQWAENKQIFKGPHPEYTRLIDSYNEQGVDKVMLLHQNTEFKRNPQPICPSKEELEL